MDENSFSTPISLEDFKKIMEEAPKGDNGWMWILTLFCFAFFWYGGNSNADYWHGKYDALKEVFDNATEE